MEYGEEQIGGANEPRLPGDNGAQARSRTEQAQEWARSRGTEATDWARSRMYEIQGRVESDPQRAILWALGAGVLVGVLLASLARRGGRNART